MGFKLFDFTCEECGYEFEDLVEAGVEVTPCPNCGVGYGSRTMSVPNLGKFTMASAEGRSAMLKKRSEEHTHKELKKEPEKFGELGKQRARKGQIRSK